MTQLLNSFLLNKKLHILFLCGWYPSRVLPTNGDFIQRHAEAVSLLHKVSVLHIVSDENCLKKVEIESKEINGIKTYIGYVKKTNNVILKFIRFWRTYFILLQKMKPFDVVHLNETFPFGIFALHLKWFQKKPFIISEHWTGYHFPQSKKINFFVKSISKKIVKNASFICPVSNDLNKAMQQFRLKGNYKNIPNVVDTSLFKPQEKEKTAFTVVHISSLLDDHKNVSGMLRVAKKLETEIGAFTWKFIGGTSKEFSSLISNLDFKRARIEFINHIHQQDLVEELQSSTVFVLFSNYENLPCVILESFSCGIPVIATNVGGISEFFPKNFGKLITVNNENELLESLLLYNNNLKIDAEKMHKYAVKKFSKKVIAVQFSELYFTSLNNSNS